MNSKTYVDHVFVCVCVFVFEMCKQSDNEIINMIELENAHLYFKA